MKTRKLLCKLGKENAYNLLEIRLADVKGQSDFSKEQNIPLIRDCFLKLEAIAEENYNILRGDYIMTQDEKLTFLINCLLKEYKTNGIKTIPTGIQEKKNLFRSLRNKRLPREISSKFLEIQDSFLQEDLKERGVTYESELAPFPNTDRIYLWKGDITTLAADAIVNAANYKLLGCFTPCHSCIDNFIHSYAGVQLREDCYGLMEKQGHFEKTGTAKITKAYNLPSKYVIHTVGPILRDYILTDELKKDLENCYLSSLELANETENIESLAFCCISTGEFRFPPDEACKIAVKTVKNYLETNRKLKKVIFNVFKDSDYREYEKTLQKSYHA